MDVLLLVDDDDDKVFLFVVLWEQLLRQQSTAIMHTTRIMHSNSAATIVPSNTKNSDNDRLALSAGENFTDSISRNSLPIQYN